MNPRLVRTALGWVAAGCVVLLAAACSGDKKPAPTPTAAVTPSPGGSVPPATPTAAGISGTPRTAVGTPGSPPSLEAAEALLRRVTLFATDVPAGMAGGQVVVESPEVVAPRSGDPDRFGGQARQWGRLASSRVAFEGSGASAGPRYVRGGAIGFATEDGAREQMLALKTGAFDDALATLRMPGGDPALAGLSAQLMTVPAIGDEAVGWRLFAQGSGGAPAGVLVAFRRRSIVGLVVLIGADDATSLVRALDMRAVDALK